MGQKKSWIKPQKSKDKAKANPRNHPMLRRSSCQFFDKKGKNSDFWQAFSKHYRHGQVVIRSVLL